MALLPRYLATTPPPRESGLARAGDIGALTRTGDIEVWRGVSRIGGAIQDVAGTGYSAYISGMEIDDIIEWGVATQRAKESFKQAEDAANLYNPAEDMPDPDDPDYLGTLTPFSVEKRDKLFADAAKGIAKEGTEVSQGFSRPKNKAQFENWYNENYAKFANETRHIYDEKLQLYQTDTMDGLWQAAAKNGDTETANVYIDAMAEHGLITLKQARARKEQVEKIATESFRLSYIEEAWGIATEIPYKDAITFLNNLPASDIDKADRNDLIARRKRQNEIETATTNKEVYWNTLRKIDTISDDELEGLVKPDSLTWDDAIKLKKIRDTENDPLKSPRAQIYFEALRMVFPNREKHTKEGRQQAYDFDVANEKLTAFLKANPDVSAKDAAEFYADLVDPAKKSWLSEWLSKVMENRRLRTGVGGMAFGPVSRLFLPPEEKKAMPEEESPSPEELRQQNTKEAYEEGKRLGYWK